MRRKVRSPLILLVLIAVLSPLVGCSNKGTETSNTGTPPPPPPPASTAPSSPEKVSKAIEQITTLVNNAKRWKSQGRSYKELNLRRALSDGIIPKEMIDSTGAVLNPWLGAAGIEPHPEGLDSFVIVFSAVPNADCVQLAVQAQAGLEVRTGGWGGIATNEALAKANCVTGNMWFIPK